MAGGDFITARQHVDEGSWTEDLRYHVAVWRQDQAYWSALDWHWPSGVDDSVYALEFLPDGHALGRSALCLGGDFTATSDGAITNLNHAAVYDLSDYYGIWPTQDLGPH